MGKWQSRRTGKKKGPTRSYTAHESRAWSLRPYGCNTMTDALEHYRTHDEKYMAQREQIQQLTDASKRRREWEAIPEWCYKNEHSLKMGRKGRLYHKSDLVGPIIDSMRLLHEGNSDDALAMFGEMDIQKKKLRKNDGYDEQEEKEQKKLEREMAMREPGAKHEAFLKAQLAPAWECACCSNTDIKTQVQHKDALLCPCGFVVRIGGPIIATHREKLGAEEGEDKTQHADRPYDPNRDKYDSDHIPTVAERRNQRKFSSQVTKVGSRAKGMKLGRLCDVQRMTEEMSSKEWRAQDVANGTKLTPKDETKGYNIIEQINKLAKQLAPVEHEVKRVLRREADRVWHTACRHCRTCTRTECCELRLIERTPAIIAASVFEMTIERLLHDEASDVRVTREHLLDVQQRMQRCSVFTNTPAMTQMATAKAMINIMRASDFDAEIICAPSLPNPTNSEGLGSVCREAVKPARHMPFSRNDSTVSCGGNSPPPTDAVVLRDAVSTVFLAHRSELPVAVRDGALRAVQKPGFLDKCRAIEDLKPYSLQCMAFCILNAVLREQLAAEPGPSFTLAHEANQAFNVGIAMKLSLDLAVAEDAIAHIRGLVPSDATSEASHCDDDDLFS